MGTKTTRDNYFYELLAERLSVGVPTDESAMARGTRLESDARDEYSRRTGKKVKEVGFIQSDENQNLGASPDGYVDTKKLDHGIEIKCLSGANHLRAYLENTVPKEYYPQGIQQFIVNEGLVTLDFVFYDPRIPAVPYFVITMHRKDIVKDIVEYKAQAQAFLLEVDAAVEKIVGL